MQNSRQDSNPKLRKYLHDIRNSRILRIKELEEINGFSFDERMEVLKTFSTMMKYYMETIVSTDDYNK